MQNIGIEQISLGIGFILLLLGLWGIISQKKEVIIKMENTHRFLVLIEQDEDGFYVASVPALQGCHTQARNLDDLLTRIREAIGLCLEAQGKDTLVPMNFIGVQQVEVAA